MQVNWGVNPYDSYRYGFGYIDTIKRQRSVTNESSQIATSNNRTPSDQAYQKVLRIREAVQAIKPEMLAPREIEVAGPASATSAASLDLDTTATATTLQSTEEVNTTPTSISTHGPEWTGSTAQAAISGEYDGSNGSDTLTFKVTRGGTHGTDDLEIKVYNSNNDEIDKIDIKKEDAANQQYAVSNGLVLTLDAGDLVTNDTFTVEVEDAVPTSFSPSEPIWKGSTAASTIGGVYDGSHGTGTLNFVVDNGGEHGVDDLKIKVYQPDGSHLEDININKEDPINTQYALSNGLTFQLGAGELLKETSFTLDVYEAAPTDLNGMQPQWEGLGVSSAQATIDGTYDGSNGTGELTFIVDSEGTHGDNDLKIKVYQPDGSHLEDINIHHDDPIDTQYALSNGLTLTLGAGDLLKTDSFTLDVTAAEQTSFSGFEPEWSGLDVSDAQVTLDGTYDGSNGTGTFNFVVDKGGIHSVDDLQVKVYQPDGSFLEDINIDKEDPLDTPYTLSNGIELTLGAGELFNTDSFTLTFTETIGSTVDPDKPFNGTGADSPNLESGFSISDGSFQINGSTINVNADDSLNDVLDRINQSDAGVTATFDASTEKVLLTQKTTGSTPDIALTNDTSGFLAAMKLDTATASPGSASETEKPLAEVDAFSAVQSGSISVNGVSIDIDVNADSLNDVLDRISAAGAGVDASFDSTSQRISLRAENTNSQMQIASCATNFFAAVGISEGAYNSTNYSIEASSVGISDVTDRIVDSIVAENAEKPWEVQRTKTSVQAANGPMLATLVGNIADSMNTLFDDSEFKDAPGRFLEGVCNDIRSTVAAWSGSQGPQFSTDFGVNFDFENTQEGVFKFTRAEKQQFESALATPDGASAVSKALFGQDSDGLFNRLHASLTSSAAGLESQSDATGLYLDISV